MRPISAGLGSAVALTAALAATMTIGGAQSVAPIITADRCIALKNVSLPDTTVESADVVSGPTFTPRGAGDSDGGAAALNNLPAFCRIVAISKPSIRFEVWLPMTTWNGKFQGVGNGGTAGVISYAALGTAIRRGYAAASTDTGHVSRDSADSEWALGRPDLVADFGHRGLHVMTEQGKALTKALYTTPPRFSYYVGCSKGGQQGLMEAQRYPQDYDGLVAGAPANYATRSYLAGHLWGALATEKDPESYIPAAKVPIVARAVTAACDAIDGITDGVIDDPRKCTFDPSALVCAAGADPSTCLTTKQAAAVKQIWDGPRDANGNVLYGPYVRGAESGPGAWERYVTGSGPRKGRHFLLADGFLKYVLFQDPQYDFRRFDYARDLPMAIAKLGPSLDAVDPNLASLDRRGGKLIVYHGWNDPSIPAMNTISYYEEVTRTMSPGAERAKAIARTQEFFRLFLVPGMQHCSGGPGTDRFDMLTALENWVEKGTAPARVEATRVRDGKVDRSRSLCPYPQVATYVGTGSTDDTKNFVCR